MSMMSMTKSMTKYILVLAIVFSCSNTTVSAMVGGRRRRRNLYKIRPCGPGQHAIWYPSKKKVESCVSCEEGKYRSDNSHSIEECNTCEAGRHSSDDLTYCIGDICKEGSYGTAGKNGCSQCPSGKYSATLGMFSCTDCESGRYSSKEGSKNCLGTLCPAGKWGTTGSVSLSNIGVCTPCVAGKFSNAGDAQCTICPDGKYSIEGGQAICIEHDKCPRNSYLNVDAPKDSSKISCKRCIYSSEYYFAAFVFAITVASLNTITFLYDTSKYCWSLIFVICPSVWSVFMNMCKSAPGSVPATVSILMNTMCLFPSYICARKICDDKLDELSKKRRDKVCVHSNVVSTASVSSVI